MKKLTASLLACLLSVVCANAQEPVKAGAVLPLSGELAFVGNAMAGGMKLWEKEHPGQIQLRFEDDRSLDRKTALLAAEKLIDADKVDILLNAAAHTMIAIAPVLNKKKIPGVVVWDSNRALETLGPYIIGFGFSTEGAGAHAAEFARTRLNAKKAAVLTAKEEWSHLIGAAFADAFKSEGGTITAQEDVNLDAGDVRAEVLRLKRSNPDVIFAPIYGTSLASFFTARQSIQFSTPVILGDTFGQNEARAFGAIAEGVFVSQGWLKNSDFQGFMEKQSGEKADSINLSYAALGYDSAEFAVQLVRRFRAGEKETALAAPFTGVMGEVSFEDGVLSRRKEKILKVVNGGLAPAE